ncbi:hypothetical protein GCM10022295_07760 [Streptomyces osmaniensis]|uniref:Uncharacterized protein n=1 Tax=Streptomyces osmaniensis TaxID=593134 RepID=A0ABP6V700_9ACTN
MARHDDYYGIGVCETLIEQLLHQAVSWADLPPIQPGIDAQPGEITSEWLGEHGLILAGVREEGFWVLRWG